MPSSKDLKVAVFYDWINQWGGAERVLLNILKIYPKADVFTLVYDPGNSTWLPKNVKVYTSFINKLPLSRSNNPLYTPLYDIALEQFNFKNYDIVISTTSVIGHCLLTLPSSLFVTYFHNINRHLYSKPVFSPYRVIDRIYSRRPDHLLCNSKTVYNRIISAYDLKPTILHPGVDTDFFTPLDSPPQDYFLIVGRLVKHKNINLAIDTFRNTSYKLKIVGSGRDKNKFIRSANNCSNIEFLGNVDDQTLLKLYQNCKALLCPQHEDFGLSAIEAQACGRPVIAWKIGGNTETIINGMTGIFFDNPTPKDFLDALEKFEKSKLSPAECRKNALRFSDSAFMLHFRQTIDRLWEQHITTTF